MTTITRNYHSLFVKAGGPSLLTSITLPEGDMKRLTDARNLIRARIRRDLQAMLRIAANDPKLAVSPKFFMQGSVATKTVNAPLHPPRQQADLDDGVYIPLSFAKDSGSPALVSSVYMGVIEQILKNLAKEQGWQVDTNNANCTRVILLEAGKQPTKHIDVSSYCMPDREFAILVERRVSLAKALNASFSERDLPVDDDWSLYPEHVLHAHKVKGWEPSDPRPLVSWVDLVVAAKSEQYRRLARYFKAWRDAQHWSNSDPKSILFLMAINMVFQRPQHERDDLALLQVARDLPTVLQGEIKNLAEPKRNENLAERLDRDGIRQELILGVQRLAGVLGRVLTGNLSEQDVHAALCAEWGPRFPAPAVEPAQRPAAVVRAAAPVVITSRPPVGTRDSG